MKVLEFRKGAQRALFFSWLLGLGACVQPSDSTPRGVVGWGNFTSVGWGIDACLTEFATAAERERYLPQLTRAGIRVLRERGANPDLRELKSAGEMVVAFPVLPNRPRVEQEGDALPENLLEVFAGGAELGRRYAGIVDAWEMVGEADVGYCRDLPDRVVAYQKALYLGIKAGAADARQEPPFVLMGALALPPGPWLERATRNGLFDYTDAYNFHFYGHAKDLAGVIAAHRAAAHRSEDGGSVLPLWITECGIKTVIASDFLNPVRRQIQADFAVRTAEQAWKGRDVALFMPFILLHAEDPFAMTLSADRPLPAWDAYAGFARSHPWPSRPLVHPPAAPNPVVVQWLPRNETCVPHKVSGSYRFRGDHEIDGAIRIYNFSETPVQGRLELNGLSQLKANPVDPGQLTVAPRSIHSARISLASPRTGYVCEEAQVRFVTNDGRESRAVFALETVPSASDFRSTALPVVSSRATPRHAMYDEDTVTSRSAHWIGTNGVQVEESDAPSGHASRVLRVTMNRLEKDPLRSRLAVARVQGVPERGFIRVTLDRPMDRDFAFCVDLLDRKGQRFTIWENFGVSYYEPQTKEVWLNLADFHPYFWGRCTERPVLRGADVEEIQLRLYVAKMNDPRTIELAIASYPR